MLGDFGHFVGVACALNSGSTHILQVPLDSMHDELTVKQVVANCSSSPRTPICVGKGGVAIAPELILAQYTGSYF
jgi:hypothetical protein